MKYRARNPLTALTVRGLVRGDLLLFHDDKTIVPFHSLREYEGGPGINTPHTPELIAKYLHYTFFSLLGRPDAEGWIAHSGGENPTAPEMMVDARFLAGSAEAVRAGDLDWVFRSRDTAGDRAEITAWRPHDPSRAARAKPKRGLAHARACVDQVAKGAQIAEVYGRDWCLDPAIEFRRHLRLILDA